MITKETRKQSYDEIKDKKQIRYIQILDRLLTGPKTAREVSQELFDLEITNTAERNMSAPRLTELEQMGYVQVTDKKKCQYTGKNVAVYEITPEGINNRFIKPRKHFEFRR